MNINILRYSLFGIAGGQEVDRNFSQRKKVIRKTCPVFQKFLSNSLSLKKKHHIYHSTCEVDNVYEAGVFFALGALALPVVHRLRYLYSHHPLSESTKLCLLLMPEINTLTLSPVYM